MPEAVASNASAKLASWKRADARGGQVGMCLIVVLFAPAVLSAKMLSNEVSNKGTDAYHKETPIPRLCCYD